MLKRINVGNNYFKSDQPPSGGCVLKPTVAESAEKANPQPPSGGCVLKHEQEHKLF